MEDQPDAQPAVGAGETPAPGPGRARLATSAWWLLGYTVLVIVWGAFVRAMSAGAGCGSHWPLCNGVVLPPSPSLETLIELSHRLTSGLLGIAVVAFTVAAFLLRPRAPAVRWWASLSLFFVVSEALLGAGLVRFEWVAANDSVERVYVMGFHLVNTFLLLGAMTLTAWLAGNPARRLAPRERPATAVRLLLALGAVLMVGASGAITALGDTLLLTEGVRPEDSPVVAVLVRSRFFHPTLAVAGLAVVLIVALPLLSRVTRAGRRYGRGLLAVFALQLGLGALNVELMAPVWLQLVHLAVSDVLWILLVLLTAEALAQKKEPLPEGGRALAS